VQERACFAAELLTLYAELVGAGEPAQIASELHGNSRSTRVHIITNNNNNNNNNNNKL
jgi:hypothetical protein